MQIISGSGFVFCLGPPSLSRDRRIKYDKKKEVLRLPVDPGLQLRLGIPWDVTKYFLLHYILAQHTVTRTVHVTN